MLNICQIELQERISWCKVSIDVQKFLCILNLKGQLHIGYFGIYICVYVYIYISNVYTLKKPLQFVIAVILHKCSHVF